MNITIEEKARRYDEKLSNAKHILSDPCVSEDDKFYVRNLFPELTESKDEKIRKEIISAVNIYCSEYSRGEKVREDMLAWLEKQDRQNVQPKFKVGDTIKRPNCPVKYRVTNIDADSFQLDGGCWFKLDRMTEFELSEPKHKFEIGDWIACDSDGLTISIKDIKDELYYFHQGNNLPIKDVDATYHFWTIKDARDGDVLAWDKGRYILIFKELKDNKVIAHCSYNNHSEHFGTQGNYDTVFDSILEFTPATLKQRNALERVMDKAGYTFDFEEKELCKIEQKSWSEEDEKIMSTIIKEGNLKPSEREWLKSLINRVNPKQEWSEEDEKKLNTTIAYLLDVEDFPLNAKKCINWLKELKSRVQLKWGLSEKEEKMLDEIHEFFDKRKFPSLKHDMDDYAKLIESIKERYAWRPSIEQMKAFENVYDWYRDNSNFVPSMPLHNLYIDLKELSEE